MGIREEAKRELGILERRAAENESLSDDNVALWDIDVPDKYRQAHICYVDDKNKL